MFIRKIDDNSVHRCWNCTDFLTTLSWTRENILYRTEECKSSTSTRYLYRFTFTNQSSNWKTKPMSMKFNNESDTSDIEFVFPSRREYNGSVFTNFMFTRLFWKIISCTDIVRTSAKVSRLFKIALVQHISKHTNTVKKNYVCGLCIITNFVRQYITFCTIQ